MPSAPTSLACLLRLIASAVELDPVAGDHRHAPGGRLDHQLDHALVLGMREGRRLAGGADRDQTVGSLVDVPLNQGAERRLIDPAIAERRD